MTKCIMKPDQKFDPEDRICQECSDFDFCYLEWLKEPDVEGEGLRVDVEVSVKLAKEILENPAIPIIILPKRRKKLDG